MRTLLRKETKSVVGGTCTDIGDGVIICDGDGEKVHNNNGYGNGAESGLAPGHSGAALPGADFNIGPRGPR